MMTSDGGTVPNSPCVELSSAGWTGWTKRWRLRSAPCPCSSSACFRLRCGISKLRTFDSKALLQVRHSQVASERAKGWTSPCKIQKNELLTVSLTMPQAYHMMHTVLGVRYEGCESPNNRNFLRRLVVNDPQTTGRSYYK